jgi:predicted glycogen debranching enzyme
MQPLDISSLNFEGLTGHEWLAVNGLGGYASSTASGMNARKYHGLLVAAMSPPVRRMVLLSNVDETVSADNSWVRLSTGEYPGTVFPDGYKYLRAFSAQPFPRWAFQWDGLTIEKSVRLLSGENTVCLTYTLLGGGKPAYLELRPLLALRGIHELTYQWNGRLAGETRRDGQVRVAATSRTPEVFFAHDGEFRAEPYWYLNAIYRKEQERGYAGLEDLWNPGVFRWTLQPGASAHLVCSAEPVQLDRVRDQLGRMADDLDRRAAAVALPDLGQRDENLEALLRAASAFVVSLAPEVTNRVHIIAQYPWSSPSGRAALMSFAGLLLVPGRFDEAKRLLHSMANAVQEGLVPTQFPENGDPAVYSGADTSLWFIAAVADYLRYTGDEATARTLLPVLETIVLAYRSSTKLGIHVDGDGLLITRSPGIPASWMDAKVGDWVMTPRFGRPVELNALWYNALRIVASMQQRFGKSAPALELNLLADKVKQSFNSRFWNTAANCCYDVVDDTAIDAAIRPNQLFTVSLTHSVLSEDRHDLMLNTVISELVTPMGLRTLSPRDSAYQGKYRGNVVGRDKAHHQGSAHPWLLGPLVSAIVRVHGRNPETMHRIRLWLDPSLNYLKTDGLGQIGELFDGDAPQSPGGATASALCVAEILRCYAQDILGIEPAPHSLPKILPNPNAAPAPTARK